MVDLSTLNPQQRIAVTHREGPALVLAGAGSGKTRVITFRIAHLVAQGVAPENILAVTFTNKAAAEMRERVAGLVSRKASRALTVSTFHALGAAILREDIEALGFTTPFTILDESDRFRVIKEVLKELNLGGTGSNEARLLNIISRAKNAMKTPATLPEARYNPEMPRAQRVWERYNTQLRNLGAVDFDDLLLLPTRILREHPDIRAKYAHRFRYVMVDEYQDTNPIQLQLLQELVNAPPYNIMVVGDDDQSIYAFRGAVSTYILKFGSYFPDPRVVALEQNYRSVGTVLEAANAVIAHNTGRHAKRLWSDLDQGHPIEHIRFETDVDEADYIARRIRGDAHRERRPYHDFAVLYRVNPQARALEEALRRERVPYRIVGGQSLFDRKEVKDCAAYLRLLIHPSDELALRRIINYPARGVGTTSMASLDMAARAGGMSLAAAIREILSGRATHQLSAKAIEGVAQLFSLLEAFRERLRSSSSAGLLALLHEYIQLTGMPAAIRANEKNPKIAKVRLEILEDAVQGIQHVDGPSAFSRLDEYLTRLSLDPKGETEEEDTRNRVTLMTLHSSKGLEFPCVTMCGMSEGLLPHRRALEEAGGVSEERRLCYVGMTRARLRLLLTRARFVIKRNERVTQKPSRFLSEIPPHLMTSYASQETERSDAYYAEMRQAREEMMKSILQSEEP